MKNRKLAWTGLLAVLSAAALVAAKDIRPSTDNTDSLGTDTYRFKRIRGVEGVFDSLEAPELVALSNDIASVEAGIPTNAVLRAGDEDIAGIKTFTDGIATSNLVVAGGNVELSSNKDQPSGYAGLDANGYISGDAIPDIYVVFNGGPRE